MSKSIVQFFPELEYSKCGYCKKLDSFLSQGMWAYSLTVSDYQDLIDRGWRRSGKYCYKPVMDSTCCPAYTIRCKALDFKISKSQKKVLKRFNRYLMSGGSHMTPEPNLAPKRMSTCSDELIEDPNVNVVRDVFISPTQNHQDIDFTNLQDNSKVEDSRNEETGTDDLQLEEASKPQVIEKKTETTKVSGCDPFKAPRKKAKQMRFERKMKKINNTNLELPKKSQNKIKQVEDFLQELSDEAKSKIDIKLVRTNPPSSEWLSTAEESHKLYVKYQMTVHNDKPEKCNLSHFQSFLVDSPLLPESDNGNSQHEYGSFHQQYWLEGQLIAVGVLDILPKCVSSVYFFYDPSQMELSLGTYGALREIAFTRELNLVHPELKYYYMGYYIHACPKMRYKGKYHPSDLLCPETYKWFQINDCIPKLESSPYSRLNPDLDDLDANCLKESDINEIPVIINGRRVLLKNVMDKKLVNKVLIRPYAKSVGSIMAKKIFLVC